MSITDRVLGDRQRLAYIASQAADSRLNVELETEGMTLNIGPQHPATHGTLRIIARLDGEQVVWAEPSCGYMHRGYEKLAEVRTYPQVTTLVNRIDWLGSFANEVPFILAAEKLMDVEAPARAQHIRTILFELSRIANVSLFLGDLGVQMGAITPVFFAFRDREYVLNLIEGATGGRFHPNFDRIGGLKDDLPKGWIAETKAVMKKLRTFCDQIEDLLFGNEIFQSRTRGIGVIPRDVALQYGLSGANLRASGVDWDLRRDHPLPMAWNKADWKVWTHPDGDSFARCWVRLQETREATKIVDQLLDTIPSGPIMAKVPKIIKVPEGEAWVSTENPLGEMGYYVVSRGELGPFRVKIRSASFNNISIAPWVLAGQLIAYELPMVLAVIGVIIQAETMNLQQIVLAQNAGSIFGFDGLGNPYVLTQFVGFVIFMIAVQAELTQAPFDMPIAESELVSGYMTEYSGFRFLIFFIGEFATAGVFALIASVLFLGGWGIPFAWFGWTDLDSVANWMNLVGPVIMITKMMLVAFIIMWVRFSYPRFREDQLQRFAWKVLIPVSLANIAVTSIFKVVM
ncbi:MAG: hypothetical protein EBV80_02945 [Acidimicrobiia bacterium]|nr:hypothetical protein [Acidimicrobiia bacterium]